MFWGLALRGNKRYSQKVARAFHVSHAALDINNSSDDPVQVVITCDGSSYILCTLRKGKQEHVTLDLNFAEGERISFTSQGDGNVHLVGYFLPVLTSRIELGSENGTSSGSSIIQMADYSSASPEPTKMKSSECQLVNDNVHNGDFEIQKCLSKNQSKAIECETNHNNGIINSKRRKTPERILKGGLRIIDLKEGNGMEARPGKKVEVYYEGRLQSNKKLFDSSKSGGGLRFVLGRGEVIKGWDLGVLGMKVGGKRKIICPPSMAYGAKGLPPSIPANSTLVFDVEIRAIK